MTALTFEQIKKIVRGAALVEEGDGKISFFRFTKEQQELYYASCKDFYMKSFATAGISLEFNTDSNSMRLAVSVSRGSSRTYFTHSVLIDGKPFDELSGDIGEGENVPFKKTFSLPEGVKKVRIQFPWSVASSLVALELDDGAMAVPVHKKRKILMFGDSITQGYDASRPELTYAVRLADFLSAEAINKGIAGEQFYGRLATLNDDFTPDLITVAYGTNDWRHGTKERFLRECTAFFKNLRETYPDTKIIALTPLWRVDIENEQAIGEPLSYVTKFIKQVVRETPNAVSIDCINLIPHRPKHYQTDGVHPIDSGFENYANNLIAHKHILNIVGE